MFFFKQKTAYEMRISDWSSDVCSSDLVGFVRAMLDAVEAMLAKELRRVGLARRGIDPDRRFLFGYSMGGMLAYRLVAEMPNNWGALWVMAAAFGGRSHDGLTPTVTHPPQGHSRVSPSRPTGDIDTLAPPGPERTRLGEGNGGPGRGNPGG